MRLLCLAARQALFVLLSMTAAALLLAACQGDGADGRQVVRFVTWKPNQPAAWQEVYRLFSRQHPELKLVLEVGPHSSTAYHDMLTQKLKNQSPDVDVFLMDVIWPPEFASAGWAAPLDELFPPDERRRFLAGAVAANTYGGHVYGVPLNVDSGLLYFRADLLKRYGYKPPRTWEELAAQAQAIVKAEKAAGRTLWGYSGQFKQYEGLVCNMLEFMRGAGGRVLLPGGGCGLAQPRALDAVSFVRSQIIGAIAPRGVLTYQEPESLDLFVQGRAVFLRSWPYAWKVAGDPAKSRVAGKVGVAPLPAFGQGRSAATLGGWQVGISAYSQRKKAAWALARFLTSAQAQKIFAVAAGRAPTRAALYDDPEVLAANPQLAHMRQAFAAAVPRPRSPLYPALSHVLQRYFHRAISDPAADTAALARAACAEIKKLTALARRR